MYFVVRQADLPRATARDALKKAMQQGEGSQALIFTWGENLYLGLEGERAVDLLRQWLAGLRISATELTMLPPGVTVRRTASSPRGDSQSGGAGFTDSLRLLADAIDQVFQPKK